MEKKARPGTQDEPAVGRVRADTVSSTAGATRMEFDAPCRRIDGETSD